MNSEEVLGQIWCTLVILAPEDRCRRIRKSRFIWATKQVLDQPGLDYVASIEKKN